MASDDERSLKALQAARRACNLGIEAAERGMAETELLGAYRASYETRRAAWLLCREKIDKRIAELPKTKKRIRRRLEEVKT